EWVVEWYAETEEVQDLAAESGSDPLDLAREDLNPPDIVESAGFWDDPQLVRRFWSENEDRISREGLFAFKTPDGAVIFDPATSVEKGAAKLADAVLYDADGNVIPLSQRFPSSGQTFAITPATGPLDQAVARMPRNPEEKARVYERMRELIRDIRVREARGTEAY